jgi:CheY-like chemotaxis protein
MTKNRPEPSAAAALGIPESIREIVIVDSSCDRYGDFVEAAQAGLIGLHFCTDGRSAVRLARRFRANFWVIAAELPDVSGFDLLDMLMPHVLQGDVDPLLGGSCISLEHVDESRRSGIFITADEYRLEDEQRALASGVAAYLVGPVTFDVIAAICQRPSFSPPAAAERSVHGSSNSSASEARSSS